MIIWCRPERQTNQGALRKLPWTGGRQKVMEFGGWFIADRFVTKIRNKLGSNLGAYGWENKMPNKKSVLRAPKAIGKEENGRSEQEKPNQMILNWNYS